MQTVCLTPNDDTYPSRGILPGLIEAHLLDLHDRFGLWLWRQRIQGSVAWRRDVFRLFFEVAPECTAPGTTRRVYFLPQNLKEIIQRKDMEPAMMVSSTGRGCGQGQVEQSLARPLAGAKDDQPGQQAGQAEEQTIFQWDGVDTIGHDAGSQGDRRRRQGSLPEAIGQHGPGFACHFDE